MRKAVIQADSHVLAGSGGADPGLATFGAHVVLSDPELMPEPSSCVFSLGYWRSKAAVTGSAPGRGSVWFVKVRSGEWALRHYRRGGLVGRLIEDHYLWTGQEQVRSFAEWRLMADLFAAGMPVPRPVAAAYVREGLLYSCDLITQRLPDTRTLSRMLGQGDVEECCWLEVGRVIRQFHQAGIDHADLNAHNLLIDAGGCVYLIDFDRARRREPGSWQSANLARLNRSLLKVCPESGRQQLAIGWRALEAGYGSEQSNESNRDSE